jgi:hypothetical protein
MKRSIGVVTDPAKHKRDSVPTWCGEWKPIGDGNPRGITVRWGSGSLNVPG